MIRNICAFLAAGLLLWLGPLGAAATDLSGTARTDTLLWRCQVKGSSFTIDYHIRRTILNAAGNGFADVTLYESPYYKLNSFEARLFSAQGKELAHVRKKDLLKVCGYGAGFELYNDNCYFEYQPQISAYPFTIVEDYQVESSSLFFLRGCSVPREIPLAFASISLASESDHPVRYKLYQLDVPAAETRDGDMTVTTWLIRDLPAEAEYSSVPPEWIDGSRVLFAPAQFKIEQFECPAVSWKNLGLFYNQMGVSRYLPLPPEVHPPASHDAAVRLADSLYEETVRQTHYVAVSVKLSGWQPEPAAKTLLKGYGDCKGLSTLLISRLRGAGLTAFPCLVETNNEGAVDTSFVSDGFNHVITMALVDHDTLWFDATSHTCPAGDLPAVDEGTFVLVMTDTGGVIVKTPVAPAWKNTTWRKAEIVVDDSGRTAAKVTGQLTGHSANWARGSLDGETRENTREFIKNYFGGNPTMRVDSCEVNGLDFLKAPLLLSARLASSRPIDRIGTVKYLLPFMLTSRTPYEGLDLDKRTVPVNLAYPYMVVDSVMVRAPWNSSADSVKLPLSDSISYSGGWAAIRFSRDSSSLCGVFSQVFNERQIPAAEFPKFSAFLAARKKLLDQPIKWFMSAPR